MFLPYLCRINGRMRQRQMLFYGENTVASRIKHKSISSLSLAKNIVLLYCPFVVWNWRNNNNQSFGKCFIVRISKSILHKCARSTNTHTTRFQAAKWKSIWQIENDIEKESKHENIVDSCNCTGFTCRFWIFTFDNRTHTFCRNFGPWSFCPWKYKQSTVSRWKMRFVT